MANKYPHQKPSESWDAFEEAQKAMSFGSTQYTAGSAVVPFKHDSKGSKKTDQLYNAGGERCYHKHPALKLPGTELVIYGGSCSAPIVKDADVYIGFDFGMKFTQQSFPWTKGVEFLYEINDMSAPKDAASFKELVKWARAQLEAGKKVHCGCIGGHGRTGTFLAALCSDFGEKDAVSYVRKNYCAKAVESSSQVSFLAEHFGVLKVEGYKSSTKYVPEGKGSKSSAPSGSGERFTPLAGNGCIWDQPLP